MAILLRKPRPLRGVVAGLAIAGVVSAVGILGPALPGPSLLRWAERLSYDLRVSFKPARAPDSRVILVTKPSSSAAAGEKGHFRSMLPAVLENLRLLDVAAIGIDFTLEERGLAGAEVDEALAQALADERIVLPAYVSGQESMAVSTTGADGPRSLEGTKWTFNRPLREFRDASLFTGLINLPIRGGTTATLRHLQLHSSFAPAGGGKPVLRLEKLLARENPSLAFQVHLVAMARQALDAAGFREGEARLLELSRTLGPEGPVTGAGRAALVETLARAMGRPATGDPTPPAFAHAELERLLIETEVRILLARLGFGAPLIDQVLEKLDGVGLSPFVGSPPVRSPIQRDPDRGIHRDLVLDLPGTRRSTGSPFRTVGMDLLGERHRFLGFVLDPAVGRSVRPWVLEPRRGGATRLDGEVLDASGRAVPSARILLHRLPDGLVRSALSDGTGGFELPDLQPGTYGWIVSHERSGMTLTQVGAPITLTTTTASWRFVLPEPCRGETLELRRTPADGDWLEIESNPVLGVQPSALTGSDGAFRFPRPAGSFTLEARLLDGDRVRILSWPGTGPDGDLRLEVQAGTRGIEGRALDGDRPLAGLRVTLRLDGARTRAWARARAGPGRTIPIPPMPAGGYHVRWVSPTTGATEAEEPRIRLGAQNGPIRVGPGPRSPAVTPVRLEARILSPSRGRVHALSLRSGALTTVATEPGEDARIEAAGPAPHALWYEDASGGSALCLPRVVPFRGALVLLGSLLVADQDFYVTPADVGGRSMTFGVEIHGWGLDNLLSGRGVVERSMVEPGGEGPWTGLILALATGFLLGLIFALFDLPVAMTLWLALVGAHVAASAMLLSRWGIWIDVAVPVAIALGCLLDGLIHYYRQYHREAGQIRATFSRFVHPALVERIVDVGLDRLHVLGERQDITLMFSDIRGFTSISEKLPPEDIMKMLNEYFTVMAPIIKKHGGVIDKYIGDAIMGFFGAPLPTPHHARDAILAALEMLEANDQLRASKETWFQIGFGINTGPCLTGILGERGGHVNFSAIGDAVNLASRLEGLNKEKGTRLLISEFTHALVAGQFVTEAVGECKVKGKEKPVKVFQVLGIRDPKAGADTGPDADPA